jgi:phytoene dehydrogenase-like protein
MEEEYDVIVIGAGVSGLRATTLLDKAGLNVLLLEARDVS